MWLTIIVLAILGYYIYFLEKRLRLIEETRGPNFSHWFSVDINETLSKNKLFLKMMGIKSGADGKDYDKWTKEEKNMWDKFPDDLSDRLHVNIMYLVSENAYFISTFNGVPRMVLREDIGTSGLIYSTVVAGDKDRVKEYLEFEIYERLISNDQGKKEWVITPCINYKEGIFKFDNNKFEVICDFPHFSEKKDKDLENLGFEVKREGGGDIYEDPFGEKHSLPMEIKYIKNGTEIGYVY